MKRPPRSFYLREDVVQVATDLLGKVLVHRVHGVRLSAIITETEAYAGVHDRASHAHGGRRTARTEVMYATGGTAYVYLCYGIHHLFNVVTNASDIPHAVLIRGAVPLSGLEVMHERLGRAPGRLLNGPGVLTKALGIRTEQSGLDLLKGPITIEDHGLVAPAERITRTPRIGVDYAGRDALLPYRFLINPNDLR
jgi:DNA-3-methyladenine glycosylase